MSSDEPLRNFKIIIWAKRILVLHEIFQLPYIKSFQAKKRGKQTKVKMPKQSIWTEEDIITNKHDNKNRFPGL